MAVLKFGNTWWGKEWLNSFNNIYDSNRLPRGQRYARNGSVRENILSPGLVEAKVQGSMPRPYKIKVSVPVLTNKEKQTVIDIVEKNSYYLGQLLASKLPSSLNSDLLKHGVRLFPKNWDDFSGNCSCPDYANPCKHLAAIIYQIANKIDLNPFVIFELKGFNLFQSINELYGTKEQLTSRKIMSDKELNQKEIAGDVIIKKLAHQIDFAQIGDGGAKVLSVLPHNPLFYLTGDYHDTLTKHYKELSKIALTVLNCNQGDSDINPNSFKIEPIKIKPDLSCDILIYDHNKTKQINSIEGLINFIKEIPGLTLSTNSTQLNALYLIFHLTRALVVSGNIIPQLYGHATNYYTIRYLPLIMDNAINALVFEVVPLIPDNLVIYGVNGEQISKLDQCFWLMAVFIKYLGSLSSLSHNAAILDKKLTKMSYIDEGLSKINGLFLSNSTKISSNELEFIEHVNLWLGRFHAPVTHFKSLLQVKDDKHGFHLSLLFKDITKPSMAPLSLKAILQNKELVKDILYNANLLTEYIPELSSVFMEESAITYTEEEFLPLFFNILPIVQLIGVEVLLPKALKALILPKLSIKVEKSKNNSSVSYLNLEQILLFNWQIVLGNQNISVSEFRELLKNGKKLVKLKDQYIYLDEKLINDILVSLDKPIVMSHGGSLLRDLLMEESVNTPFILSPEVKSLIAELLSSEYVEQPNNLLARLRDYQYQGYCWLYKNVKLGFGSVIADDMGLGKTLQVISCILKLKQEKLIKNSLVVVPTSLLTNWQKEIERFAPDLSINMYHGASRGKLDSQDITLITYGIVRRDIELINKQKWDLLVIDEAQNIKNLTTQQTKIIKSIKSKYRIAMSGTPVENRLLEYYSIMDFANKGYLGTVKQFNKQFAIPIEGSRDIEQLDKFIAATKPFVLRRIKSDKSVIQDLPDKIVIDEYCSLTKQQTALYQATLDNIMRKLREEPDDIKKRGLVLTLILALKQICNHPSQYLKQFNDIEVEASGKLLLLLDKVREIHANNEKALIFTQFAEMGNILQKVIEKECNTPVLFLYGGVSRAKRDVMVNLIQTDPKHQTMILSIKAGGVGLNLTGANHVIHYDMWWNPAVENQATDRAYRIGQNKNVFVHRLICSNSFEEKINQMIKDKQELANLTVATGEQWIGNLSDKEIQQIFTLN